MSKGGDDMKTTRESKRVARYIVKANDRVVGWSFSEKNAKDIAFRFEYECMNQDEPFTPKMEIIKEEM